MIKRYKPEESPVLCYSSRMSEYTDGEYVKYEDCKKLEKDINLYVEWLCGQTGFSRWYIRGKIRDNDYNKMMEVFEKDSLKENR